MEKARAGIHNFKTIQSSTSYKVIGIEIGLSLTRTTGATQQDVVDFNNALQDFIKNYNDGKTS